MKRNFKGLFWIVVVVFLFLFGSSTATALSNQTSYISINDNNKSLNVGDLSFSNLTFKDYSSNSILSFGLTGDVTNSSDNNIDYISNILYYDANYNLIAKENNFNTAMLGTSNFN